MCSFGNIFAIYCKLSTKGLGVMTAGKAQLRDGRNVNLTIRYQKITQKS